MRLDQFPNRRYLLYSLCIFLAAAMFLSCPPPFDGNMLLQVKDELGPYITITSPADGSVCAKTVIVTGTIEDSATESGDGGRINSVWYEVPGSDISGKVTLAQDGSFSFQFPTTDLGLTFLLKVIAEDWNGNQMEMSLNLKKIAGNDIPSFTAVPASGKVTLSWDPVPLATEYTIYYEKSNIIPNQDYSASLSNVTSPYLLDDLTNGNMHVFMLRAHSSEGNDNWSDAVRAIPLSENQLTPNLTPEADSILVEWNSIQATDEFEVWKSTQGGSLYNVSGVFRGNSFRDTSVQKGEIYSYAVRPAANHDALSMANLMEPAAFLPFDERGPVGRLVFLDGYSDIVIQGTIAFVAAGAAGLRILDISDPSAPFEISSFDTPGNALRLAIDGSFVYIADQSGGLRVINAANLSVPVEVTNVDTSGEALGVVVADGYAYVAAGPTGPPGGLRIIDVSTPSSAAQVGFLNTPSRSYSVDVSGDYAYVSNQDAGLLVIDILDPENPEQEGACDTDGSATDVVVEGSYAYVADMYGGLKVIDIGNPASPTQVGHCPIPHNAWSLSVEGSFAYVASSMSGLRVISVSDPTHPAEIGYNDAPEYAWGVAVDGFHAFVADMYSGLYVVDVSAPSSPTDLGVSGPCSQVSGITISGRYAYLGDSSSGFYIADISDPDSPSFTGPFGTPTWGFASIAIGGDYAYVLDSFEGPSRLVVFDCTNISSPVEIADLETPGSAYDILVSGCYAYIADGPSGIRVIDVSIPSAPEEIASYSLPGSVYGVDMRGGYIYAVSSGSGLHILDVSDPGKPKLVGSELTAGLSNDVATRGNVAYVADLGNGLCVIDVTIPTSPSTITTVDTLDQARKLTINGEYLYLVDSSGFSVVSIHDPYTPTVIGHVNTSTAGHVAAVSGDSALLFNAGEGLHFIDLWPYD
jgi:hypothetical protein